MWRGGGVCFYSLSGMLANCGGTKRIRFRVQIPLSGGSRSARINIHVSDKSRSGKIESKRGHYYYVLICIFRFMLQKLGVVPTTCFGLFQDVM